MCNAYNHPLGCQCGFGGEGHLGRRGSINTNYQYSYVETEKFRFSEADFRKNITYRSTYSLTIPNAKCPVCGDLVYYYQNDYGSKVFFDSLGKPWPKHPCTDTSNQQPEFNPKIMELRSITYSKSKEKKIQDILGKEFIPFEQLQDKIKKESEKFGGIDDSDLQTDEYLLFELLSKKKADSGYILLGIYNNQLIQLFTKSDSKVSFRDLIILEKIESKTLKLIVFDSTNGEPQYIDVSEITDPDNHVDAFKAGYEDIQFELSWAELISDSEVISVFIEDEEIEIPKERLNINTFNKLKALQKGKITIRLVFKNRDRKNYLVDKAIDLTK